MRVPRVRIGKGGWSALLASAVLAMLATGSEAATRGIDFDGDRKGDLTVYRASTGTWYVQKSSGGSMEIQWGDRASSDIPVAGDYDNDAITDAAVWRPANGTWYIRKSSGGSTVTQWGDVSLLDVPVPGDYDGDGKTDVAVWRATTGTWYILYSSGGTGVVQWGDLASNDRPVPGDYDGDGKTDIAVWRASNGTWYIKNSSGGSTVTQWGDSSLGDQVTLGDFDGDGMADPAVWRSSTGTWYVKKSTGGSTVAQWGDISLFDVPYPVYYDNDNIEDIAVWRRTTGTWYIKESTDDKAKEAQWGDRSENDMPVAAFLRPLHMDTVMLYDALQRVVDLFAVSVPDNAALDPVFHPNFLEDGRNKTAEIASWTSGGEGPTVGWFFTDLLPTFLPGGGGLPGRYIVHFTYHDATDTVQIPVSLVMARYGNSFVQFGDQTPIGTEIRSAAIGWVFADNSVTGFNGLVLNAGDWSNTRPDIQSIKVTGPGLSPGGVVLDRTTGGWFPISGTTNDLVPLDDATIATMGDIGAYTCRYYDTLGASGTQLWSTNIYLLKRPTLSTELTQASFPSLVSPTSHAMSAANPGGPLFVSWTNPPGTFPEYVNLNFDQGSYGSYDLGVNQTSAVIDSTGLPFPPTFGELQVTVSDKYYRQYQLNWQFLP